MTASTSQTFDVPMPELQRVGFEEAWDAHRARVFHWALRYGAGDAAFAEDLTHDVFLKLWSRLPSLDAQDDLGGWLYTVTARLAVTVAATGSVLAGGAGGKPGAASGSGGGGGGGGAGGMVGIEAPMLTLAAGAVIAANGGGGGQGAGNNVGNAGQNGQPSAARATGGNTGSGGVGGLGGGGLITAGGNGATDGSGGGGAGGASGFISFKAAMRSVAGAIVSPTATIVP